MPRGCQPGLYLFTFIFTTTQRSKHALTLPARHQGQVLEVLPAAWCLKGLRGGQPATTTTSRGTGMSTEVHPPHTSSELPNRVTRSLCWQLAPWVYHNGPSVLLGRQRKLVYSVSWCFGLVLLLLLLLAGLGLASACCCLLWRVLVQHISADHVLGTLQQRQTTAGHTQPTSADTSN